MLQIQVKPWANVEIDGSSVGVVWGRKQIPLGSGVHVLRLTHPDFKPVERSVTIHPGKPVLLELDLDRDASQK